MAKKRRHRYACKSCRKPFNTLPEMWGHTPHCAARKLSQQPGTLAGPEALRSAVADRESRRPGPGSQESKLCLLDTYELIQQLQKDAHDFAGIAYLLAQGNVRGEYEKAKEWLWLSQALGDVDRDFDLMVGPLRLDRSLLFRAYHQLGPIRDAWMHYRTRHLRPVREGEQEQEIPEDIREEEAMWATIMTNLKKLLAAAY